MQALSDVVRVVAGEDLIVHILRALQALATVAGILSLPDVTLATVSAVCEFTSNVAPDCGPAAGAVAALGAGGAGQEGEGAERTESMVLAGATAEMVDAVLGERVGEKGFSPMERVGAMARPAIRCGPYLLHHKPNASLCSLCQ